MPLNVDQTFLSDPAVREFMEVSRHLWQQNNFRDIICKADDTGARMQRDTATETLPPPSVSAVFHGCHATSCGIRINGTRIVSIMLSYNPNGGA